MRDYSMNPLTHRDALEFSDGQIVLLTGLFEHQEATVLQLPAQSMSKLRSRSCIIDGEAVACREDGISSFDLIRYRRNDDSVFMWAFDLIELNGDDLRLDPLAMRKATLAMVLAKAAPGCA